MGAPQPQLIPEAFAQSAAPINRNAIPDAPLTAQRASFQLGFPPQTMTPIVAGGKPMLGPDMNGILYMLSSHTYYQQSGQPYRWNADVVVAIAGYASGTLLGSTDGETVWFNTVADNATDPDAPGSVGWVPMFSYGITLMPATTGGVVTASVAQASKGVIVVSGALIANSQLVLPTSKRRWLIINNTSGAFVLTVRTAAGTGVQVPQGGYDGPTEVYGDGVNLYPCVAPITLPTSVAPTPSTIVLRSNNGYVYASYLNQSSAVENFTISEVYAGIGDGFLRKISKVNFAAQILANAALTGTPTAPTPPAGDNSTRVATTAFAQEIVFDGATGHIVLPGGTYIQWGSAAYNTAASAFTLPASNFSAAFPNVVRSITATSESGLTGHNVTVEVISKTNAAVTFRVSSEGSAVGSGTVKYIAIGR